MPASRLPAPAAFPTQTRFYRRSFSDPLPARERREKLVKQSRPGFAIQAVQYADGEQPAIGGHAGAALNGFVDAAHVMPHPGPGRRALHQIVGVPSTRHPSNSHPPCTVRPRGGPGWRAGTGCSQSAAADWEHYFPIDSARVRIAAGGAAPAATHIGCVPRCRLRGSESIDAGWHWPLSPTSSHRWLAA